MNWTQKPIPELTDGELETKYTLAVKMGLALPFTQEIATRRAKLLSETMAELDKRGIKHPIVTS